MTTTAPVDPLAAATYFVGRLGCTAFPVWGSRDGHCSCGDPHDGVHGKGYEPANVGKHPATVHGFKDATDDVERIATFLANPGTPNYGLIPPEGVLVIDVDGEGLQRWDELQHRHGPLPVTFTTTTANGRHYWFRWPQDAGPMPRGQLFGFVVRHHGDGYVIGPGSIHPSGTVYDTLRQPTGMPFDIAELPPSWVAAITDGMTIRVTAGRPEAETVAVGGRHDWLRDTARYYAGVIRDRAALKAAIMVENAKLAEPKTEAAVERAIDRVLEKFPADPVGEDEDTGEIRRVGSASDEVDILEMPPFGGFPEPPDRVAFEGRAGEIVGELAEGTSASEVGLLGAVLAFGGVLVPGMAYFYRTQTSSPFVALVGESGIGRKGTAMHRVADAFGNILGTHVVGGCILDGINSGEGLVNALHSKQAFRGDATTGLVFEEEFASLLASRSREGSNLDPKMRQAFDGGYLSNRRSNDAKVVNPPYWLPALIAITPAELRSRLEPTALQSGSANRWLYLPVVERPGGQGSNEPPALSDELRDELIAAHREGVRRPYQLEVDPRATSILNAYDRFLHGSEVAFGLARDLNARLSTIAFRVALVHALLDRDGRVRPAHLARALALTEYARRGIGWVFGDTTGNADADLLYRHLQARGRLSKRSITQHIVRDPSRQQRAIDELQRLGWATVVHVQTGGRPRTELLPGLHGGAFVPFNGVSDVSANTTSASTLTERTKERNGLHESRTEPARNLHGRSQNEASWASPCYFYTEHQSSHRRTDAGFICTICAPTGGVV